MALVAGADGCPQGWICVTKDLESDQLGHHLYGTALELIRQEPTPIALAIDIPIGLTEMNGRICDAEARAFLGQRHVCVFSAPIRSALSAETRLEACRITSGIDGRNVGCQAWAIYGKIREVDAVMRKHPELQNRVFEVHPEVCFGQWNETPLLHRKKSPQGKRDRKSLIDRDFGHSAFTSVRENYRVKDVGHDDIADAFAALWTAERKALGTAVSIPVTPIIDSHGLRMEMWY